MGERANQVQDGTQPGLQDEDTIEGISVLGHICMSLVWPREHGDLPIELGCYVGSASK